MAKRSRATNQKVIDKRIKEGRGQGEGTEYIPWLLIQDVSSQGLATRIKGWKTKRVHHLMSNLELDYFYILEWSPIVCDIREQYPLLPLEETIAIANLAGIPHPKDPITKEPIVMTTDFLVSVCQKIGTTQQARTIKSAKDLQSERTIEKLEIERLYWQERDIDWGIVTEREIPETLTKNVHWLHSHYTIEDLSPLSVAEINRIANTLSSSLFRNYIPLTEITTDCDNRLGLDAGTSLAVVRYLIANRQWLVDLYRPIQPSEPLNLLAKPVVDLEQAMEGVG